MKQILLFIAVVFSLLLSSCVTNKDIVYLQDKGTTVNESIQIQELNKPYRIQVNDILRITVKALDAELVGIFNPNNTESSGESGSSLYFNGFTVDVHGNIKFPILGDINVLGFTVEEVEKKVKNELLTKYFKETAQIFVTAKLSGLRYTVTGEVGSTGTITLFQERVNIIEALANSGDILSTGDRKDIIIIRQYPQGQQIHHIDLTDIAALKSPYYYIKPNDMILVKPLKRKAIGAGETATQTFTTIASIFSVLVSTYFLARNL